MNNKRFIFYFISISDLLFSRDGLHVSKTNKLLVKYFARETQVW